ncbi:MAG TPA: CRTAC1 family protein [Terracidiphilus sp.]
MPSPTSLLAVFSSALLILAATASPAQSAAHVSPHPSASPDPPAAVPARFVDITARVGVHFQHQAQHTSRKYLLETMGSGVALFDCDNDGRLDLFAVNGAPYSDPTPPGFIPQKSGPQDWNRMYHQKPDGTFEDITEKSGLKGVGYGMGVAVADYDNDGNEDLFVTAYGSNRLYHNNGNCTFTDVTEKAGVAGSGWSTSATWIDLDNDGLLDLVVERYVTWDWNDVWCGEHREGYRAICHPDVFPPIAMLVYHNDGNGHFTEVAHKLGLDKPAKALGIAIADYDRDGRNDIFVANDSMPEFLFHQKVDGTFEEVGLESETAVNAEGQTFAGMGVDFADYDNDGWPDIVVTDLANQRYALYHNNRDGTFDYAALAAGVGSASLPHSGWGARFVDYDNDGWKDLLVAQGHDMDNIELVSPQFHYREPMMLLRNTGGRFIDVAGASGDVFHDAWVGRGLAIGDLDNDGRIDAVITTNGGGIHILHNETATTNHWLTLRLVGHKSNRDGIGAVVKVVTNQGSQWVTASTSGSYLSASDPRVHFGLGNDALVLSIEVRWPSGAIETLVNVKTDQQLQIDEPSDARPAASPAGFVHPQP